jgi:UPF0755 protein
LGLNIDEIITIASIIEREARLPLDFRKVSAVIHNRLNSPHFDFLECDATVLYQINDYDADLMSDYIRRDLPYNTYTNPGLPPSAVCNPGYNAIFSALHPDNQAIVEAFAENGIVREGNFYYFVSDARGQMHFARTHAEHIHNINTFRGR